MRKLNLLLLGCMSVIAVHSQNPATTITIANRNIILPCGTNCVSITAQVPHIKQTNDYVITNPGYVPFAYTTPGGTTVTPIYIDDTWSPVINPGFNFCFYGSTYSSLLMGSNSAITFDVSRAGQGSGYSIAANGTIPSTTYAPSMIFGPYHDIHPGLASTNKKIEWRVEGTAPNRRFIGSYNDVPYFGGLCTVPRATHQMVLYEGTGVVEVYIKDKPFCTDWNGGRTILGMQNQARTSAVAATGKNATVWGSNAMDSCFRFIPSAGISRYKSAQLLVNGNVVYTADTSTLSPGVLNLNFPNVCPTVDSTTYVLRLAYNDCPGDPPGEVVFTDTIVVKRLTPTATTVKVDPTCLPNGSITITASGGTPGYQYSINGGTTYQPSNVFTGLAGGTYTVIVRDALNCTNTQTVILAPVNTLTQTIAKTDASCTTGGTITITATGGGTAPYQYSINGGTTYQSSNTFTGLAAGTYNVITRNPVTTCTATGQVTIAFINNLTMGQVSGGNICRGTSFTPTVTSNAASFSWSPTTGVSNTTIANPVLTPQQTTTYTVTGTLGSCTLQRTFTVTVFEGATANAGPDVSIIAGDVIQLQATASAGSYLWTPSTGLSAVNIIAPNANPVQTATYTLNVTSPQGCLASDNVTVTVVPYCIKPMEAFTPNGDGINDLWLITNGFGCLTNAKAQVFNRYGSKVFESNDYKNNWNGTYEGKPLPDATYYYVISFKLINGKSVVLKGNLTILR